ncbi:MAG: class II aldolase/adducin family protein [Erysipelotrichaceae bacterium]|nr:class II aldolase/adducin family protein [Erysipelotrichaceae bacterium]
MLESLKERVCKENQALLENGLVKWTSGNVSARDPETNYVIVKPSGVLFPELTPEKMLVVDLDGNVIEGDLRPSVDMRSHLYVYKHRSDINGVIHTHSPYATSFAITGEPLKVYTTTAAGILGAEVPVSDFVLIGEDEIGKQIVEKVGKGYAILIRNHGVFTVGETSTIALKAAIIVEENAQYVHYAMLRNKDLEPFDEDRINMLRSFYLSNYGQNH